MKNKVRRHSLLQNKIEADRLVALEELGALDQKLAFLREVMT